MSRIIDGYDVDALAARVRGREYTPDAGAEVDRLLADPEIAELASLRRPALTPPRHPPRYRSETESLEDELSRHAPVRAAEPGEVL